MSKFKFERENCSRCGGNGKYSYCAAYGSTCFKCSGSGKQLTKKGKATRAYYLESLSRPVATLEVGDAIYYDFTINGGRKWHTVTSLGTDTMCEINPDRNWIAIGTKRGNLHVDRDGSIDAVRNQEELTALRDAAMLYQENLTKAGKPRKVRAKKAA